MLQPTENGKIDIGTKATVVFKKYRAKRRRGALTMCFWKGSSMNSGVASNVVFAHNNAHELGGGHGVN